MNHIFLLLLSLAAVLAQVSWASDQTTQCARFLRAESFRQMSRDELSAHRDWLRSHVPPAAADAICESTAAITFAAYQNQIARASDEYPGAGGPDFDPAELYFFLECGSDRVELSPLAYHAFNLNRDEYGFIGESTLAIVWMSVGYLDIDDPGQGRSFMDAVHRLLAYAREKESQNEIGIYEDLLQQIKGFREDYEISVEECRSRAP